MIRILENINNPLLKSFGYRVWNTFKSIVLPIVLSMVLIQLQNNPNDLSCLQEQDFWVKVLYSILVALLGSAVAGLDKVNREKTGRSG